MDDDRIQDWLRRIDPSGTLIVPDDDEPDPPAAQVLPVARLAVAQSIVLALIVAVSVVTCFAIVMRYRAGQQAAQTPTPPVAVSAPQPAPAAPAATDTQVVGGFAIPTASMVKPPAEPPAPPTLASFEKWAYNTGAEQIKHLGIVGRDLAVCATSTGTIYGVDGDGQRKFSYNWGSSDLRGMQADQSGVLVWDSRRVVLLGSDGNPYFEHTVDGPLTAAPVLDNNLLFLAYGQGRGGDCRLEARYTHRSETEWTYATPHTITAITAGGEGIPEQGSLAYTVEVGRGKTGEVVRLAGGKVEWRKDLQTPQLAAPAVGSGRVFVAGRAGGKPTLFVLRHHDAKELERHLLPAAASAPLRTAHGLQGPLVVPCGVALFILDWQQNKTQTVGGYSDQVKGFGFNYEGGLFVLSQGGLRGWYGGAAEPAFDVPLGTDWHRLTGTAANYDTVWVARGGELLALRAPVPAGYRLF